MSLMSYSNKKNVLFIFGTRPEAIKMAPLIKAMQKNSEFKVSVCVTGQHKEMLYQVLDFFKITPNFDLKIMEPNQTLFSITSKIIKQIELIFNKESFDLVIVQGDTTTAFVGALSAFYKQIPVAHVEAGLRTGNKYSPFPEEINRELVSKIAEFHFTPTELSANNLAKEGIEKNVFTVGNTVIDALLLAKEIIKADEQKYVSKFSDINFDKKIVLITSHRRESIGEGFKNIMNAILNLAENNDIEILFPMHYSPSVRKAAKDAGLVNLHNIHIIDPLDYPSLVFAMEKSYLVLTDSGGIQEEAPSFGKPVLVMRNTTERPEGINAGVAKLIGTKTDSIIYETEKLLANESEYKKMSNAINPYGDGKTSDKILSLLKKYYQ